MSSVRSKDGTSIAYDRVGRGPALILVGGGLDDGSENAPLAPELAEHFTVLNYARRGRGGSGDTLPYAVERELEDLDALIAVAGGSAHLFGASSGGALALEAAAAGLAVNRIAVYEVPYLLAAEEVAGWRDYVAALGTALSANRRDDALALFMRLAGSTDEDIASARRAPVWSSLLTIAHTLAYDAACLGDGHPPTARLATITNPTLAITGGRTTPDSEFFHRAAAAVAATIPGAHHQTIDGLSHMVDAPALAPVLRRFLA